MTVRQRQRSVYPTLVSTAMLDSYSFATALFRIFQFYKWSSIYVIFDNRDLFTYCGITARALRAYREAQQSSNTTLILDAVGDTLPIPYAEVLGRSATVSRGTGLQAFRVA